MNKLLSAIYVLLIVRTSCHMYHGILCMEYREVSVKNVLKIKGSFQMNVCGVPNLHQSGIKQKPQAFLVIFN